MSERLGNRFEGPPPSFYEFECARHGPHNRESRPMCPLCVQDAIDILGQIRALTRPGTWGTAGIEQKLHDCVREATLLLRNRSDPRPHEEFAVSEEQSGFILKALDNLRSLAREDKVWLGQSRSGSLLIKETIWLLGKARRSAAELPVSAEEPKP